MTKAGVLSSLEASWRETGRRLAFVYSRYPRSAFLIAFLFLAVLLFLHNPRMLLSAEFWGEDGPVWYAEAYDYGWLSLVSPRGGYLNSIQRLIGIASQPFPLHLAPSLFAAFALLIQVMPAAYLVSDRMNDVWPDRVSRLVFAVFLVVMPNAPETSVNATNSQWNLAILAFLLLIAAPARGRGTRILENSTLLISGLSGPFGILFAPVAALQLLQAKPHETRARAVRLLIIVATSLVQGLLIVGFSNAGRVSGPLGASLDLLVKIVALAPLGATFGYEGVAALIRHNFFAGLLPSLAVLAVAVPLMVYALMLGPRAYRQYVFFSVTMLALALAKPLISSTEPQWPLFLHLPAGNRYFLYPMIGWWIGLVVVIAYGRAGAKILALALCSLSLLYAVPRDWGERFHFPKTDFVGRARAFEAAPVGTRMKFETHPTGVHFSLVKKGMAFRSLPSAEVHQLLGDMAPVSGLCALDASDGILPGGDLPVRDRGTVSFRGWGAPLQGRALAKPVLVLREQDSGQVFVVESYSTELRGDVANALHRDDVGQAGFLVGASVDGIAPGRYRALVHLPTERGGELCDTRRVVVIESGAWMRITQ